MNKEQAVKYLSFSGFSDEQIKAIEGAFTCDKCVYSTSEGCQYDDITETIPPFETSDNAISRQAVLNTLENMDRALDEDRTVENYKELLRECYKVLPSVTPKPKSECEHDHEILKAYSDGANAVLDKIRAEIDTARFVDKDTKYCRNANATGLEVALDIIDKYIEEGKA
jgi:hypothetical protein